MGSLPPSPRAVRLRLALPMMALAFTARAEAQPAPETRLRVEVAPSVGRCLDEDGLRQGLREVLVRDGLAASHDETPYEVVVRVVAHEPQVEATLGWVERATGLRRELTPITVPRAQCDDLRRSLVTSLRALLQAMHEDPAEPTPTTQASLPGDAARTPPNVSPSPAVTAPATVRPPTPPASRPLALGGMVVGAAVFNVTPSVMLGLGLGLRVGRERWRAALSLHWNRSADDPFDQYAGVSLRVDRAVASLRGCYGDASLGLCLVTDAGVLVGRSVGTTAPETAVAPSLALGAGGELVFAPRARVALRLSFDVLVNVVGANFEVARATPRSPGELPIVWEVPVVSFVLGVSPTLQFR